MFLLSLWHVCSFIVTITAGAKRCSAAFTNSPRAAPVVRQQLHHSSSSSREPSSSAVTAAPTNGEEEGEASAVNLLPVGIFVDLDNIRWSTYSRADAQELVRPFRTFGQRIGGKIVAFEAFGNKATQTWRPPEERERFEYGIDSKWDLKEHHTGYDKDGLLRCGICGARMKLSIKDRARGLDMEDKLNQHMKMLHDKEQAKRINMSKGRKRKMNENEMKKFNKYEAAQIDTGRRRGERNQLFSVLKEVGIRCHSTNNVDAALIKNARQWMGAMPKKRTRGCLMVLSNDSDFCELLDEGHRRGYLVVSATLEETQTRALEDVSDLVLRLGGDAIPEPMTRRGSEFMLRCEERWKRDRARSALEVWDLTSTLEDDERYDNHPARVEESLDKKEGLKKNSSTRKHPPTQPLDAPAPYFKKILKQYPELDITNRKKAERVAALTKVLRNTKKKDRRKLVLIELRIRLYHRGVYHCIPGMGQAGMGRLALVLHCAERGERIRRNFFPLQPAGKYAKMSPEKHQEELRKRNLKHVGSKKQLRTRLESAVSRDVAVELMGRYSKALVERGLDDGGHQHEIIDRLVKAVLGLEEIVF